MPKSQAATFLTTSSDNILAATECPASDLCGYFRGSQGVNIRLTRFITLDDGENSHSAAIRYERKLIRSSRALRHRFALPAVAGCRGARS